MKNETLMYKLWNLANYFEENNDVKFDNIAESVIDDINEMTVNGDINWNNFSLMRKIFSFIFKYKRVYTGIFENYVFYLTKNKIKNIWVYDISIEIFSETTHEKIYSINISNSNNRIAEKCEILSQEIIKTLDKM